MNIDDDGKLKQRFINKCVNAKKEGILCRLTFDEYCSLVYKAGLKSSQLGFTGEKYVLARYNDKGDYTLDNCRFITQRENAMERKVSKKAQNASSNNINTYNAKLKSDKALQTEHNRKISDALQQKYQQHNIIKRKEFEKRANKSYLGSKNSQYGTYWITNGINNTKWHDDKGNMPTDYYKGRKI